MREHPLTCDRKSLCGTKTKDVTNEELLMRRSFSV